jgi:eukaryotic-like serine/threonine-protein kinase
VGPASESVRANDRYRMRPKPLGEGSYAKVFFAVDRASGASVALKRAKPGREAKARIKREIEAQRLLAPHPYIMPILDHDPGYEWYAMPVARGTLVTLREDLDEEALTSLILNLADALDLAHQQKMVHRDISPMNILALEGSKPGGLRWVVADWGMVRRPSGKSSPRLTRTGAGMGTPGFDAPELDEYPSKATEAADVYSLGRVVAWFVTGKWPKSGYPLLPDGPALRWRMFVKACTEANIDDRLATMHDLREALDDVFTIHDEPPAQRTRRLLEGVLQGEVARLEELVSMALAHRDDPVIYLDHLARVPTGQARAWALASPGPAAQAAACLAQHLLTSRWEDRDLQYVGTPLGFVHAVLQALVDVGDIGNAQDVAGKFFAADAHWNHPPQRRRSIEWLTALGPPADVMAMRVLVNRPELIDYYRAGLQPRSPAMAAIFR